MTECGFASPGNSGKNHALAVNGAACGMDDQAVMVDKGVLKEETVKD